MYSTNINRYLGVGLIAMLLLLNLPLWAQTSERLITGNVTDDKGDPLVGVSVVLKGSTRGTNTDNTGHFQLSVQDPKAIFVFSFIGYTRQEITIGTQMKLTVTLKADAQSLSEVVVIGYGEQSRRNLSTAIAKVSGRDLSTQPVTTPGDALAGLAVGVQVSSARGGMPGDAPLVRIRGVGSIGANNDVLYVVDGYPLQNANNFSQINPADIETMDVLKDAASAAIYGSRAANGVIIVTTKRGKSGKTHFDFSAYTGVQQVAKRYEMMNKNEYLSFAKRAAAIRNVKYPDIFDQPDQLPDTDWQKLIYRDARISNYQLSAAGGTENLRFLISAGYLGQDGVLKGTDYTRYSLRVNIDANLSSRLKLGVSLSPSYSQQHRMPTNGQWNNTFDGNIGISTPNAMQCALLMPPIINARNTNGDYGQPNADPSTAQYGFLQTNLYNPLASLELVENRFRNYRTLGNGYLEWNPVGNLVLKTSLGATVDFEDQYGYVPPTVATANASAANITTPVIGNVWGIERNARTIDYVWENTATYRATVGAQKQHNLSGLLLYSVQKYDFKLVSANGKSGTYSNGLVPNISASTDLQGGIGYDQNAFLSFAGRIQYDYRGKYLLTAALRRDGSSKFGPNQRFSNFPSISAAWRVFDEPFMEKAGKLFSDLKLRASYGETGNANIGSFTWANSIIASNYVFGGSRNIGGVLSGLSNYDLTWEKNRQTNLGLDAALFANKFTLSVDYYNKVTDGMLLNKDIAGITGYASTTRQNVGSLENRGLEVNIGTNLKLGGIRWQADYNFSTNTNKILSLGGPQSLPPQTGVFGWNNVYRLDVGQPIGNMYGFVVEGVFKNADDLTKYPQWNGNGNLVGDWRIKDIDGDGKITEADRTLLGNAIPKHLFSTTQRFAYQRFDASILLTGVSGVSLLNGNYRQLYAAVGAGGNVNMPKDVVNNFFDPAQPDRDVKYPRLGANTGVNMNNQATQYSILDASYVRLRNITIGYNVPKSTRAGLNWQPSIRLYVSAQNLLTFTAYPGANPEASASSAGTSGSGSATFISGSSIANTNGDSVFQPGIDHGSYPATRTLTAGISIAF